MFAHLTRTRLASTVAGLWLAAVLAPTGFAAASGLQVTPTSLSLQPVRQADGLWLRNTGSTPLHAQVRVYHWSQADGVDQLTPTRALVASPPIIKLDPENSQLVRIIRTSAPPDNAEEAYRVVVNELPVKNARGGLNFVLRYSIPVFVEASVQAQARPELEWSLSRKDGQAVLDVTNHGNKHAQISDLVFNNASGQQHMLKKGLLGYALPGMHMHWVLNADLGTISAGSTLQARVNGESVSTTVSLDAGTR